MVCAMLERHDSKHVDDKLCRRVTEMMTGRFKELKFCKRFQVKNQKLICGKYGRPASHIERIVLLDFIHRLVSQKIGE